jgi:integrative and conjugative element protein (TIGR02256 family)
VEIELNKNDLKIMISKDINNKLNELIQKNGFERAGSLMGQIYTKSNTIVITHILEAEYKLQDKYNVEVNNHLLNEMITKIWEEDNTMAYVGDWHTHPEDNPIISSVDIDTIHDKFINGKFSTNILIDIIIGRKSNFVKGYDGNKFYSIEVLK